MATGSEKRAAALKSLLSATEKKSFVRMLEKVTAGVGNDDGPGYNLLPSAAALSKTKEEIWNVVSGPYVPLGYGVSYCNQSAQIHPAWKRQIKGLISKRISNCLQVSHPNVS